MLPVFDEPRLVSVAGLAPVLRLGQQADLCDVPEEHLEFSLRL